MGSSSPIPPASPVSGLAVTFSLEAAMTPSGGDLVWVFRCETASNPCSFCLSIVTIVGVVSVTSGP